MSLFSVLAVLHIAAGFVALVSAPVAAIAKGVDASHRLHVVAGRIFFGCMCVVGLTAVPMSFIHPNTFLFLIALFSLYLALAGWRFARNRSGRPTTIDWIRGGGMSLIALAMIGYGIALLANRNGSGITLVLFGGIGGALGLFDLRRSRAGGLRGRNRIAAHLTMMLSATIAATTAFTVTNVSPALSFLPPFVPWLLPTVLITPLIVHWNRSILKRTKRVRGMAD